MIFLASLVLLLSLASPREALAQEDAGAGIPFKQGDVIGYDEIDKLRDYVPEEFWQNRDFFFYEGMQLEVGPAFRDYSPAPVYQEADGRGRARGGGGRARRRAPPPRGTARVHHG